MATGYSSTACWVLPCSIKDGVFSLLFFVLYTVRKDTINVWKSIRDLGYKTRQRTRQVVFLAVKAPRRGRNGYRNDFASIDS